MYETGIAALVGEIADADPAACDRDELAALVAVSQRVRAWLDAFDARIALHASRLASEGSCEPASSLLTGGGRRSSRDAEASARRAAVCADLPEVHDALGLQGGCRLVMSTRSPGWPMTWTTPLVPS